MAIAKRFALHANAKIRKYNEYKKSLQRHPFPHGECPMNPKRTSFAKGHYNTFYDVKSR